MPSGVTNGIRLTCKDKYFEFLPRKSGTAQDNGKEKKSPSPKTKQKVQCGFYDIHGGFKNQSSGSMVSSPIYPLTSIAIAANPVKV
jgi:hypothetical protein